MSSGALRTGLLAAVFAALSSFLIPGSCLSQVITTVAGSTWVFRGDGGAAVNAPLGQLSAVAVDAAGNIFAVDQDNHLAVKITPAGTLVIVAGNGTQGFSGDGGPATGAALNTPLGVALDAGGNVYITDSLNYRIRKVTPAGTISTVAGNGTPGFFGDGGPATGASLGGNPVAGPTGVAVDASGNLYIADSNNLRIRKVNSAGTITTIAGNGIRGFSGDGGPATGASLYVVTGVAVDAAGNLYIADPYSDGGGRIRKVTPAGTISTVAGNGLTGGGGDGGPATSASLNVPNGVAVDSVGNLYIADRNNRRIRRVTPGGTISTVAGGGFSGFSGDGGPATSASLFSPSGVTVDAAGNLYIADTSNYRIRKVASGIISTVAGNGLFRFSGDNGPAISASLQVPIGVAVDAAGNLYFSDSRNYRVRKVTSAGAISTVAGNGITVYSGDGGPATSASFNSLGGVAVDAVGSIFLTDLFFVRKVTPAGTIIRVAGGGSVLGDGGPATNAFVNQAVSVAVDSAGNLYIADTGFSNRVRKVTVDGTISTVAGNGTYGFSGDGGPATSAQLAGPSGVTTDSAGNLYIADYGNHRIRKVTPTGTISTVAGNGTSGFSGDGGAATNASLYLPRGVAVDTAGNLYIADAFNHCIRKVTAAGTISTVAGNGAPGFSGDGGAATNASLNEPTQVAVDLAGNLYIADSLNHRIRKVTLAAPSFTLAPLSLSFSATAGTSPAAQQFSVSSTATGLAWTGAATTQSGGSWLSISSTSGTVPSVVAAIVNTTGLAPGTYNGTVTVQAPLASPSMQTVSVSLAVAAAPSAQLAVASASLTFAAAAGTGSTPAQTLRVSNAGAGTLIWTASSQTSSGGNWLALNAASGTASTGSPATLQVTASAGGLSAGTYLGSVVVASSTTGESKTVPVTLLVSQVTQTMLLSQSGLTFTAVEGGSLVPAQNFGILNTGQGTMSWTVDTSILGAGNWLTVTRTNGSSTAGALDVPLVDVGINVAGLRAGQYTGFVRASATGATNSPQLVTVTLNVLPPGTTPPTLVRPTGLIFVRQAGTSSPGSQTVRLATAAPGLTDTVLNTVSFGGNWLDVLPRNVAFSPTDPRTVVVQPTLGTLAPGEYRGAVALAFSDGPAQAVDVLFVVTPPASVASEGFPGAAAPCIPQKLYTAMQTLGNNFAAPVGWPTQIRMQVKDDCDNPIPNATVIASFSNGDAPLALVSLGNGLYDGSWRPLTAAATVVTVRATLGSLAATTTANGQAIANTAGAPSVSPGGIVHAANYAGGGLAPGSIVSIFGSNMANGQNQAPRVPLPTTLGQATLTIGGLAAPLFYSQSNQINAQLPFELTAGSSVQAVLRRVDAAAVPEIVALAPARPGVFSINQQGTGQGAILNAQGRLVDSAAPAAAGQEVAVFCTGLGATQPAVRSGDAAPAAEPLARVIPPPTATVGGQLARVTFAGLAPGFVGLYQVNVQIPAGLASGNAVPLVLSQGGVPSNAVTLAVR